MICSSPMQIWGNRCGQNPHLPPLLHLASATPARAKETEVVNYQRISQMWLDWRMQTVPVERDYLIRPRLQERPGLPVIGRRQAGRPRPSGHRWSATERRGQAAKGPGDAAAEEGVPVSGATRRLYCPGNDGIEGDNNAEARDVGAGGQAALDQHMFARGSCMDKHWKLPR